MVLDKINKPNDIKKISPREYKQLAFEIRKFLIEKISKTGGHLASNLGVVELTMAMQIVYNLPKDKIIWDVGHQSYAHKILTGRKAEFDHLRKFGGISGFPKRDESDYDAFDTGHSTTSLSAGLGIAKARDIMGEKYKVVSVIGDGSFTGGMAFEALNNISSVKGNYTIVLNDNNMSIANNVGGMSEMFNNIRTSHEYIEIKHHLHELLKKLPYSEKLINNLKKSKDRIKHRLIPGEFFESFGLTYFGPVDGHNISQLIRVFKAASEINGPVFVHVKTVKGKGYAPAEDYPQQFHGVSPFIIETGEPKKKSTSKSYAKIFSEKVCELARENDKIVGITAAMPDGVGLTAFSEEFPDRYFDVGIAEQHATTFSAGLAAAGMVPIFAVYSSFLQRAYDQIIHDVCNQNLKVIFAIDHAGLVGSDGETHQGIFDISFLSCIPNMTVLAPINAEELRQCLDYAVNVHGGPIALRYPSGAASNILSDDVKPIRYGCSEYVHEGSEIAIVAVGRMMENALKIQEKLKNKGIDATVVNARFVYPIDRQMIRELSKNHKLIVTMEENVASGGYGEHVSEYVLSNDLGVKVLPIALPDAYVEHGNINILFHELGMDVESIYKRVESAYNNLVGSYGEEKA